MSECLEEVSTIYFYLYSVILIDDFHPFVFFIHGYIVNPHDHAQLACLSQVVRALHQYHHGGHGFESRTSPSFFGLYFRNCLS